ncbi:MAG: LuxR C-terminal-related transcriptional regulator [Muribaculaceae bacterium]|nr:LuxR C-terminal-related transcriptional regulator [Muribaculaceae bacterium]
MARMLEIMVAVILWAVIPARAEGSRLFWPSLGKDVEAFDSMMERAAFVDMPKCDLKAIAARLYVPVDTPDPRQARARICFWKGWVAVKDDPLSARRLAGEALQLCDSARYPYDHARFSMLMADSHRYNGDFAEAYFLYRDKSEILKSFGDDFWTAKAMVCLGAILLDLGEYPEADMYYSRAQTLFEKTGSQAASTKNRINLANTSFLLGDKQKGLSFLKDLDKNKYVANDSIYVANVLVSRFHISGYTDTAAARRAYDISLGISDDNLAVISRIALGISASGKGEPAEGARYYASAFAIADRLNDHTRKKQALEGLEKCYSALGRPDSAEICRQRILMLNDSVYYQESIADLKRSEFLSTINSYEQTLRRQEERHRMRSAMTMSLIAFLLVVVCLSFWLLQVSRRRNASERRLQEEKNRRLELLNRQYTLEIEAKEKEIASNTMILAQKNARLKELAEQIQDMEKQGEISGNESRILNERISSELSADDDWKYFKLRFDKVHPVFFASLKESYPDLSRTELRLCAYIRVGMSAKEIAQIMSVRPETVNTSRYRIRRKMQLSQQESLEAVLENF